MSEYGIINTEIDRVTPCLVRVSDGSVVQTEVVQIHPTKKMCKDWEFDWTKPEKEGFSVYALLVQGEKDIQGLIALHHNQGYTAIDIVESAPQNSLHNPKSKGTKQYEGVGAHLFAEACKQSFEAGNEGFVSFTAKNMLIQYYKDKLGAEQIGTSQQMYIDSYAAEKLVRIYYPEVYKE